jgi:hypothetical protein
MPFLFESKVVLSHHSNSSWITGVISGIEPLQPSSWLTSFPSEPVNGAKNKSRQMNVKPCRITFPNLSEYLSNHQYVGLMVN